MPLTSFELTSHAYRPDPDLDENYTFRSDVVGLRLHQIWCYFSQPAELPEPEALIRDFEEAHRGSYEKYGEKWTTRYRRLIGLNRKYSVRGDGTLRFMVCSPEIPFFGRRLSNHYPDTPIIYSSIAVSGETTPNRYFLNGRAFGGNSLPVAYAQKFAFLETGKRGFVPDQISLDDFFPVPRG